MSFAILRYFIFRGTLEVNGREAHILPCLCDTSPVFLLSKDRVQGFKVAGKAELEAFAQKYRPWSWMPVYGVEDKSPEFLFGPLVPVYVTAGATIVQADQDLIRGFRQGTWVLYLKT